MSDDLPLTAEDVAEIAAIIEASPYRELDLSTRRFRLRLARGDDGEAGLTQEWQWAGSAPEAAAAMAEHATDPDAVPAPLPGTFYHAPQPGAPPFVAVGDEVGPETVVGIVETMKLMNPVHAGRAGRVAEVIVPNATMVAKGQPLFRLA
ncbi:biotin/lipoyl-containing protein [Novosphingobium sp.]|uniref:acetyl-CoA carboxylase biotin carboxyl carrier protein n=1 Tax=Novosphingobium sp. TaxID=1874826 RepID=UPI00260B21DC|nr:biotin/lipoyl-containing protein [Novosphingobium sp.]